MSNHLNTLNPNSRLELYECVSISSAEVTVTRSSIEKHLAKEGYDHSTARMSDNALHEPIYIC